MEKQVKTTGAWWRVILCIIAPLLVGGVASLIAGGRMATFSNLNLPPLAPPAILFPIVWTILYILMGVASFLIWKAGRGAKKEASKTALILYGIQLALNFGWTIVFFNLGQYWMAFAWLVVLLIMVIALTVKTAGLSKAAMWMLVPYVVWCLFAGYLNLMIAILN